MTPHTYEISDGSLFTMITSLMAGVILNITEPMFIHWDFPVVFLHGLQALAWTVTSITGIISIYTWWKKRPKKEKKDKKKI